MIRFEIYSEDLEDKDLVSRFWALSEDKKKHLHNLKDLLPYKHISNSNNLVRYINSISSAWDELQICQECGSARQIRGRSEVRLKLKPTNIICRPCQKAKNRALQLKWEAEAEAIRLQRDAEDAKLTEALENRLQINLSKSIFYSDVPDDIALILLALDRAITPRLFAGSFAAHECKNLAPEGAMHFIKRLFDSGVITDNSSKAYRHAYKLKDENLSFSMEMASYRLVSDKSIFNDEEAFNAFHCRDFSYRVGLRNLWLDYAVSDCMAYLYRRCQLYNLTISNEDEHPVRSLLRSSLEIYSISQLWCVIWKVVEAVAALSTRTYYNKEKAAATIHGKIMRHIEDVKKSGAIIKQWGRLNDQPSGTLGEVFNQYFKVDENTSGSQAIRIFSTPVQCNYFDTDVEIIEERAEKLMRMAIGHGIEAGVMLVFSSAIRNGMEPCEALDYIFTCYPQLSY